MDMVHGGNCCRSCSDFVTIIGGAYQLTIPEECLSIAIYLKEDERDLGLCMQVK